MYMYMCIYTPGDINTKNSASFWEIMYLWCCQLDQTSRIHWNTWRELCVYTRSWSQCELTTGRVRLRYPLNCKYTQNPHVSCLLNEFTCFEYSAAAPSYQIRIKGNPSSSILPGDLTAAAAPRVPLRVGEPGISSTECRRLKILNLELKAIKTPKGPKVFFQTDWWIDEHTDCWFLFGCLTEQLGNLIHWSFVDESSSWWAEKSTTLYSALHICLEKSWNEEMAGCHAQTLFERFMSPSLRLSNQQVFFYRFEVSLLRRVGMRISQASFAQLFLRWMWVRPRERVNGKLRNDWMTRPATGEWVNIGDSMCQ